MAFRKRNIAITPTTITPIVQKSLPGTRPSSLTPESVTSTGTNELDTLLGGHGGLLLGSSLLIEEHGTTDYAGALLRAFTAEGLLQGHQVHLINVGKTWSSNLPAVAGKTDKQAKQDDEKMKIAWRYESMERASSRAPIQSTPLLPDAQPFCHTFDLTKRLDLDHKIDHVQSVDLLSILTQLRVKIEASDTMHRIVLPSLLSPIYYPLTTAEPAQILQFMHGLQALLKKYSSRLVAMMSMPLSLYPRASGVVRWMEHLSDGVIEMVPFPYIVGASVENKGDTAQGMIKMLKLPLTTDRGEGGAGAGNTIGDDLAFTLSRRKFVIEPFSLPPVEGDQDAQQEAGKITAKDVEF